MTDTTAEVNYEDLEDDDFEMLEVDPNRDDDDLEM